ncbi:class III lanthionine synthetase LanKC N-terminal domain-containing protein [Microbacterium trichothecenolyticum]|uniref:class III lanthionine synthetase LanKC N-terminal domain-containing protein n=1 Tax=Microbacterium trichothecenolyticum TaxID=69370 RepID=UPI0027D7D054|nr:hypothetical protein [Microbacterium trichothecenolyticum]
MQADDLAHVFEGRCFFEAGDHLLAEAPLIELEQLRHAGWRVHRDAWWTRCAPADSRLPPSGWKVHVSPDIAHLTAEIERAIEVVSAHRIAFKVRSSAAVERRSRSKFASRTQVGKTVVAYPRSADELVALCAELDGALRHPGGPTIVGDLRIGSGPIHVRHGAFEPTWIARDGVIVPGVLDDDGVAPDDRTAAGAPPAALSRLLAETGRAAAPAISLPLERVTVLHRTAGGGVYAGLWRGVPAVVKEGRRDAGLDAGGTTAAERLRHEARVLTRLSGSGAGPELVELVETPDGTLLVMEQLPGTTLHRSFAARHPPAFADEHTIDAAGIDYRRWSARIRARVGDRLAAAHARGVAHGDVSPQNVLVDGDEAYLIDYESAALDGVQVAQGIVTPGFGSLEATPATDLAAADALETLFVNPLLPALSVHRPWSEGTRTDMYEAGLADLAPGFRSRAGRELVPQEELETALRLGIHRVATPEAPGRMFPGGVRSFRHPAAPLSVAHGAAGVISALRARGDIAEPAWIDALEEHARRAPAIPGAGEGLHGVLRVLAEAGRVDAARELADRLPAAPTFEDASWSTGDAGRAACLFSLYRVGRDAWVLDRAIAHVDAVVAAPPRPQTGLARGLAGIALALAACAGTIADTGAGDPGPLTAVARRLLAEEPRRSTTPPCC